MGSKKELIFSKNFYLTVVIRLVAFDAGAEIIIFSIINIKIQIIKYDSMKIEQFT